jgi:hypothetical protein
VHRYLLKRGNSCATLPAPSVHIHTRQNPRTHMCSTHTRKNNKQIVDMTSGTLRHPQCLPSQTRQFAPLLVLHKRSSLVQLKHLSRYYNAVQVHPSKWPSNANQPVPSNRLPFWLWTHQSPCATLSQPVSEQTKRFLSLQLNSKSWNPYPTAQLTQRPHHKMGDHCHPCTCQTEVNQ